MISRSIFLLLILLAVITASLYFLVQAEGGYEEIPRLLERVGIDISRPAPQPTTAPNDFTSGQSRFSQGRCTSNTECQIAGCSGEVCTNNSGDVITTCEYSESFPNARGLTCQCLPQGICGWE